MTDPLDQVVEVETSVDEWIEAEMYQIEVMIEEIRKAYRSGKRVPVWKINAIRSTSHNLEKNLKDQDRLNPLMNAR